MRQFAKIVTAIPGPKSVEILKRKEQCVASAFDALSPAVIAEGHGALIKDVDGNTFIDFTGGIGALNVGHSHPEISKALHEQIDRFLHTDFTVIPYENLVTLAEKLAPLAPVEQPAKCAFFNSGAEAVENACKYAKVYSKHGALISFEGGFHGRTMGALSLTSKNKPYKQGFGPFLPDVYKVPYANCYRCPIRATYPACGLGCADLLDRMLKLFVSPEETAAVVIEPVQGEGGFVVPPKDYLRRISDICHTHGVLLVVDEVQTGFGRTGKMFASEHSGVKADMVTMAKSIAAGIPLSAVVGRAEVMDSAGDSRIGGTYVGSPLGCAAGIKVLEVMERENLPQRAEKLGKVAFDRMKQMQERCSLIGDVRGLGLMVGMELVKDRTTKEPAAKETSAVIHRAMEKGVIPLKCGLLGNVIRVLVSLVATEEQILEGLDILEESIVEIQKEM